MWGCNSLIWVALAAAIIGIGLLVFGGRRRRQFDSGGVPVKKLVGIALVLLAAALAVTASYMSCSFKTAACPPAIGGNGYVCTNEGAGCFGISPGKCKTVAGYWPWESPCECKCE